MWGIYIMKNKNNDTFSNFHPIINFCYLWCVIIFSMIMMHPICLCISLAGAVIYSLILLNKKALKRILIMLPIILFMGILNPLFNHKGMTILWYFPNGNPLTLESIVYGAMASIMFASVIMWFNIYNHVMTSDKTTYMFGRIMPSLSMLSSMVLRFVPLFIYRYRVVGDSQKCLGKNGNKIKNNIRILSIVTTWSLENAVDTADSMKARGYGLKGRTSFSIFRFCRRDTLAAIFIFLITIVVLVVCVSGGIKSIYFPSIIISDVNRKNVIGFIAYTVLFILPVMLHIMEEIKWKSLR